MPNDHVEINEALALYDDLPQGIKLMSFEMTADYMGETSQRKSTHTFSKKQILAYHQLMTFSTLQMSSLMHPHLLHQSWNPIFLI